MTRVRAGVAVAVTCMLAAVIGGCGSPTARKTDTPPSRSTTGSAALSTPGASASAPRTSGVAPSTKPKSGVFVIHIRNFAYVPPAPVVLVGQRIEIINDDVAAHTWSAAPRSNWTYTSGNLEKGQAVTFAGFTKPGHYPFLCYYHGEMPSMNGTVTVEAN